MLLAVSRLESELGRADGPAASFLLVVPDWPAQFRERILASRPRHSSQLPPPPWMTPYG